MGGIETAADAIGVDLFARLAWQNKKQREGLALLVATALQTRTVNLNELAAAAPCAAARLDMRYQWIGACSVEASTMEATTELTPGIVISGPVAYLVRVGRLNSNHPTVTPVHLLRWLVLNRHAVATPL